VKANVCWATGLKLLTEWKLAIKLFKKNKFREELIGYFPLIYGPHRKPFHQQFFVAAGTSLLSCYLATIGEYTDGRTGPIENDESSNSSIAAYILCLGKVFTEPLPSNDRRGTHTDTQTDGRDL
jgi:hypothetical protein